MDKKYKLQVTSRINKLLPLLFILVIACGILAVNSSAEEITVLFTGETHAALYHCNCPIEPDGGLARRATLIKELRKGNPNAILVDSGGFFAGGIKDEYAQNPELDKERTRINIKALELMRYDALAIGDNEFELGSDFFDEILLKSKVPFLSCNIKSDKVSPYTIKETGGVKIGIIGITPLSAMPKAGNLKFMEPKIAVKAAVEELKNKGVHLIILLSQLGEAEDAKLLETVQGIDVLIAGNTRSQKEPSSKVGATLVLWPAWQGKKLGKASLKLKNNQIIDYKVEELRLWDKIEDDPEVASIMPHCFSDANCKKEGFTGTCQNAGSMSSSCAFTQLPKIDLVIITPKICKACNTSMPVRYLRAYFPGLSVSYLYYPQAKAVKMVRDFGIVALPVYLLDKAAESESGFTVLKESLEKKGDYYMLKPAVSGLTYFVDRPKKDGRLDFFISLFAKNASETLGVMKDYHPQVHFLAVLNKDKFEAARGNLEVEECLRGVCVQKYYPEIFWNYITCRAGNINSSWWEDCLLDRDAAKIKACARSVEGAVLLKDNISLNQELQVMLGPTFLMDNIEIFSAQAVPSKEELDKLLKK